MALSARIYDTLDMLNVCRHKFEGIFSMHGVRTGSPEDVPTFVEKLLNDRNFAMDFWGLVRSLEAVGERISERQIRRTVVDCLCGEWLPNDDPAVTVIDRVFDESVGERVESMPVTASPSKWGPQVVEARFDPVDEQVIEPVVESVVEENTVFEAEVVQQGFVAEVVPEVEASDATASDVEAAPVWQERPVVEVRNVGISSAEHIDQVLSRLELINLELKLHLDDIESRVNRIEPHIEELKTQLVRSLSMAATVEASVRAVPTVEPQEASEETPAPVNIPVDEARAGVGDSVEPELGLAKRSGSLRGVGNAMGAAACLALILWLWGRPRVEATEVAPVPASSAVVGAAPKEIAKEPADVKAEVQAEVSAAISKAAAPDEDDQAGVSGDTETKALAKGSAKTHGTNKDDLVAPPWTKWYGDAAKGGGKAGKVGSGPKVDAETGAKGEGK